MGTKKITVPATEKPSAETPEELNAKMIMEKPKSPTPTTPVNKVNIPAVIIGSDRYSTHG